MIEAKGKKPFAQTNNISYVFLTNNDNQVKISYDDRRYCGIECNNEKVINTKDMGVKTKYRSTELFKLFNAFLVRYECNITSFGCELNKYNDYDITKKKELM